MVWDEEKMFQSNAMARFVAKKAVPQLYGETLQEQTRADMAADFVQDFYIAWNNALPPGEPLTEEKEKCLFRDILPNFFGRLEKIFLSKGRKFVAGDKVK